MEPTRDAIILVHAMRDDETDARIVAVGGRPVDALQAIAHALDWRIERIDAVTTNLNDMDAQGSPLSQRVWHAGMSELDYVIVVQRANPALLESEAHRRHLERIAHHAHVVVW